MKKTLSVIISLLMLIGVVLGVSACSDMFLKLPTTNYEKAKFAFNGVEKSFQAAAKKKTAKVADENGGGVVLLAADDGAPSVKTLSSMSEDDALSTIYNLFNSNDDDLGDSLEDLSYNEPPFIQFQYMKAVLEKIGENYKFGEKYTDTMTGEVYIDFSTGVKTEENAENKAEYELVLSMDIRIGEDDLIKADVSFEITLTKGESEYHTVMLAFLELDYDMQNKTPNYTLTMNTKDEHGELPYYDEESYTYEQDYLKVKDNKVVEWRKLILESSEILVKDADHQTLDTYFSDDFSYQPGNCKWYKNRTLKRFAQMRGAKKQTVGSALFEGIGLNSTDIDGTEFIEKQGTKNSVIKTNYDEFCRLNKGDIVYDFISRSGDRNNQKDVISSIGVIGAVDNARLGNVRIIDLLSPYDYDGMHADPSVLYLSQFGDAMGDPLDLSSFRYYFKCTEGDYDFIEVSLNDTVRDAYKKLLTTYKTQYSSEYEIKIYDPATNFSCILRHGYNGNDLWEISLSAFPQTISDYGVPAYSGENAYFIFYDPSAKYIEFDVNKTNRNELNAYCQTLAGNGFTKDAQIENEEGGTIRYYKRVDNTYLVIVITYRSSDTLHITANKDDMFVPSGSGSDPEEQTISAVSMVGDFNDWSTENNCVEFTPEGQGRFTLMDTVLNEGEKFKIVVDHDWEINGGYGYNDIGNISGWSDLFAIDQTDGNGNVLVKRSCSVSIDAIFDGNEIMLVIIEAHPID